MNNLFSNKTKSKEIEFIINKNRTQNNSVAPRGNSVLERSNKYNLEIKNKQQIKNILDEPHSVKNLNGLKNLNAYSNNSNLNTEKYDNNYDNKLTRTRLKLFVSRNDNNEEISSINNNLYDVSKKIVKNNLISENLKNKFSEVFSQSLNNNKSEKKELSANNNNNKIQLKDNNMILNNNKNNNSSVTNLNNILDIGFFRKKAEKGI